ncbi:hypothetical protein F5148DRAFT_200261 [Russula earlei]|uniref:Uncharacterized protein n=1 Tax=Russula earlei TaxID=71964 RepID=A0ACC0U509_9AGAM|nr:hypothetical protein F5148DRAFT_200261 [Russula earlei]
MPESSFPCTTRFSTMIGSPSQASLETSPCEHRQVTIDTLPDEVLVKIFFFYVNHRRIWTNGWHTLLHVCQRWRHIALASPRRLNLRLEYTGRRPMSEIQDVWPVLPVVISHHSSSYEFSNSYLDSCWGNVASALESEHRHRICRIDLSLIPTSRWERLAAAMQNPFPELTSLRIWVAKNTVTSLPDSFLGGSAPLLRRLSLSNCPFPGIPKLLLSANQLLDLRLWNISDSGYISPQELVTALSVMSRLKSLYLEFQSPLYPASRPPPPPTRSVLPALTQLTFKGVHDYLEDLLAQIEAPLLKNLDIVFFMDLHFVLPQLHQLISQAESFKSCNNAAVYISDRAIQFAISRGTTWFPELSLRISCRELDLQLASLGQVRSSTFPLLSNLVQLDITDRVPRSHWNDDMETAQWLELLDPFTAITDLRLSDQSARHVCQALEELAEERVTEILPALQNIFLKGLEPLESVPKYIGGFVAARKLSGHPVAIRYWE